MRELAKELGHVRSGAAAVSGYDGSHPLLKEIIGRQMGRGTLDLIFNVDVDVDKARRHHLAVGVDLQPRGCRGQRSDSFDPPVADPQVSMKAWASCAIHDQPIRDDKIVSVLGGGAWRLDSNQANQRERGETITHHLQITQISPIRQVEE